MALQWVLGIGGEDMPPFPGAAQLNVGRESEDTRWEGRRKVEHARSDAPCA